MIEIEKEGVTVLVSIISQSNQDAVPKCDAHGGKKYIGTKGLLGSSGNKGNIGASDGDDAAEEDCHFPMIAKGAVGRENGFLSRGKTCHQTF